MSVGDISMPDRAGVEKQNRLALPLRVNFAWTLAGNVVYAACQWGMLVVLAKLGTTEMVGQFALGLAVTAPVFMFTNLQLRGIQATDTGDVYQFADYFGLRLLMTILALCGLCGLVLVSGYRWETALVVLSVGIAKAAESLSDICYGSFQQHERMDRIAKSMIVKGILSLLALGGGVALTVSVLWGTVAMASVWLVLLIVYDLTQVQALLSTTSHSLLTSPWRAWMATKFPVPRWHAATLRNLGRLSFPLGIVMMLISLNSNIPRYFIERHLGEHSLGIYAALAYLMVAGNTVIGALGQSASPRLARFYAAGQRSAFSVLLLKLCAIGAMIGIAGVFIAYSIGQGVLRALYRPEYAAHVDVFLWLMIAAGVGYVSAFLGYGMTAARRITMQTPLFATVTVVTVTMCALLVPRWGLIGAAQASMIAAAVNLIGAVLVIRNALRELKTIHDEAR